MVVIFNYLDANSNSHANQCQSHHTIISRYQICALAECEATTKRVVVKPMIISIADKLNASFVAPREKRVLGGTSEAVLPCKTAQHLATMSQFPIYTPNQNQKLQCPETKLLMQEPPLPGRP